MSYSEELFSASGEESEILATQTHQLSPEMGRFNGRVYVNYSSEEASEAEESFDEPKSGKDSQRPAPKNGLQSSEESSDEQKKSGKQPAPKIAKPRSYKNGPQSSEESSDEQYRDRDSRLSAPKKVKPLTPRSTNGLRAKVQSAPTPKRVKLLTPRSSTFRTTPRSRSAGKENSSDTANRDHLSRARKRSLPLLPRVSVSARSTKSFFGANSSSSNPPPVRSASHENYRSENYHPTPPGSTSSSTDPINENPVLQELRKANQLLVTLVSRVEKTEERMEKLERNVCTSTPVSSSSSDHKASSRRKKVPLQVRRETRRVYGMLMEEDDNFEGWSIGQGKTFNDPENQAVLRCLVREVKGLDPHFLAQHIHDAAYRYYRTQCEESSARRRGKCPENRQRKRRHERLCRKLLERRAALGKMTFEDEKHREKWQDVLKLDLISSEESGKDDNGEEVIYTKPLPWRSKKFNEFVARLDIQTQSEMSSLAKRQKKKRIQGEQSERPRPHPGDNPDWVFASKP